MKRLRQDAALPRQLVLGCLVVGIGMLALIDQLGWWDARQALQFWPAALILLGVLKLADSRRTEGYFLGVVLIGVGATMVLDRLGWLQFDWRMVWPVLLIAFGVALLYRALAGRRHGSVAAGIATADDTVDVAAILGGFERRITTPAFRGGAVWAIMGGCALDMRASSIEGEALIDVFVLWGGVTIKVPPDWTVILHGTPVMGGFEEKTVAPPDQRKRLVVRGYAIMGGVQVRN